MKTMARAVKIGNVTIGRGNPVVLIAGPCVIESEESAMRHARALVAITGSVGLPFIFKSSYDKANRTSADSPRGPGLEKGLRILKRIKDELRVPVLSDVHCTSHIDKAAKVLDVIQIPAFLSRQTDLILAAAKTGKPVNIKKGQFMSPWDMRHAIKKVESAGNYKILLTERGASFGYNNLVSDFRSVIIMKDLGYPVIYDATHSVQTPGGMGKSSGGDRRFVPQLSLAAIACGADGLFVEVHQNPDKALSDGMNSLRLSDLQPLLARVKSLEKVISRCQK